MCEVRVRWAILPLSCFSAASEPSERERERERDREREREIEQASECE